MSDILSASWIHKAMNDTQGEVVSSKMPTRHESRNLYIFFVLFLFLGFATLGGVAMAFWWHMMIVARTLIDFLFFVFFFFLIFFLLGLWGFGVAMVLGLRWFWWHMMDSDADSPWNDTLVISFRALRQHSIVMLIDDIVRRTMVCELFYIKESPNHYPSCVTKTIATPPKVTKPKKTKRENKKYINYVTHDVYAFLMYGPPLTDEQWFVNCFTWFWISPFGNLRLQSLRTYS